MPMIDLAVSYLKGIAWNADAGINKSNIDIDIQSNVFSNKLKIFF